MRAVTYATPAEARFARRIARTTTATLHLSLDGIRREIKRNREHLAAHAGDKFEADLAQHNIRRLKIKLRSRLVDLRRSPRPELPGSVSAFSYAEAA